VQFLNKKTMIIREAQKKDIHDWATMRSTLWPNSIETNIGEIEEYFAGESIDIEQVLVLETIDGRLAGFIEINIRNFAEGSRSSQVPYIEAWYIEPQFRGKGYGKKMLQAAEHWALAKGFVELASDTTVENEKSIRIHKKLGFEEKDRVVCFLKKLNKG